MLNLSGLTFAQKLHALKWGQAAQNLATDAPPITADSDLGRFMQRFEQLQKDMPAREAYAQVCQETGKSYKSYKSFTVARSQYYRNHVMGPRPPINANHKNTTSMQDFLDEFETLQNQIGPFKAYNELVRQTGKSWASFQSFINSRFAYYHRRGKRAPALGEIKA